MNTLHSLRHSAPVTPVLQSVLKLQSDTNKTASLPFEQFLEDHLQSTTPPADGVASQSTVTRRESATPASSSATPASIADQLLAANQPPSDQPFIPVTGALYTPAYIQQFTYNGFISQANLQNQQTAALYQLNVSNWALNEGQREGLGLPSQPPPAAPQYVAVNAAGYDQWWSSLANLGDPPPVNFITPIAT